MAGKSASAYELCSSIFPTSAKSREALWTYAHEAATAEREVQGSFAMHRETTIVNLTVDADVWSDIKMMAKERKTSAAKLAAEILRKAVGG